MASEVVKKNYDERKQEVETQLRAAGYEPCGDNRYSRIEASGKEYVVCIDERGQLWTL